MSKFENLPDEILIEIFRNLESDELWRALKVCERWQKIIRDSSLFMRKLNVIFPEMCDEVISMKLPIKNLTFESAIKPKSMTLEKFATFIQIISNSLELLTFDKVQESNEQILQTFTNFQKLKKIKYVDPNHYDENVFFFNYFKSTKTLESIEYINHEWFGSDETMVSLFHLLEAVPNIKHVTLDGTATHSFFEVDAYNFKLHRLDAYIINNYWWTPPEDFAPGNFFTSQLGHLKHLKLGKLPYDYDGGRMLKFLIEEMKLESFFYGSIPLIRNGKKNEKVEEVWFNEVTIKAGMELMRQFPGIKRLKVWLCMTGISEGDTKLIVDEPTEIFLNLKKLIVTDHSGSEDLLNFFMGLYKNCRNIEKLIIDSTSSNLGQVLCDVLPHLRGLKELDLPGVKEDKKLKKIIEENGPKDVNCIWKETQKKPTTFTKIKSFLNL